jgi:cellulose biosynthesis protein BcsQ
MLQIIGAFNRGHGRWAEAKFTDCIYYQASNVSHGGKPLAISLLPSSAELRPLEREIIFTLTEKKFGLNAIVGRIVELMKAELARSVKNYDYIIIDCAPGISAVAEASIRLADLVIVPTIPDFLSTYGLRTFCKSLWGAKREDRGALKPPKNLPMVLITRERKVTAHRETVDKMRNERQAREPAFELFDTVIPEAIGVAEALGTTKDWPTFTNKWGPNIVPLLSQLANETQEALNGA